MGSKNKCLDAAGRKMQMSYSGAEFFPGVCSPQLAFLRIVIIVQVSRERGWREVTAGKNNKSEEINHHLLMAPPFQMQMLFSCWNFWPVVTAQPNVNLDSTTHTHDN